MKQRMVEVGDNWSYKSCKAPVKSSPPTNQHPVSFTDRMPFLSPNQQCRSTEGKNITFPELVYPKLTWGLPTLSLTTNSSCYLGGGLPCLSSVSPLMPAPQFHIINYSTKLQNLPTMPFIVMNPPTLWPMYKGGGNNTCGKRSNHILLLPCAAVIIIGILIHALTGQPTITNTINYNFCYKHKRFTCTQNLFAMHQLTEGGGRVSE